MLSVVDELARRCSAELGASAQRVRPQAGRTCVWAERFLELGPEDRAGVAAKMTPEGAQSLVLEVAKRHLKKGHNGKTIRIPKKNRFRTADRELPRILKFALPFALLRRALFAAISVEEKGFCELSEQDKMERFYGVLNLVKQEMLFAEEDGEIEHDDEETGSQ